MKANRKPIASAGVDQTVREGANVTLDGSRSYDPDRARLTYSWTQVSGMQRVVMNGFDTAKASFKAPIVSVNNSSLTFKLPVKDSSGLNSSDLVRVIILKAIKPDNPPRANAGVDQAAAAIQS